MKLRIMIAAVCALAALAAAAGSASAASTPNGPFTMHSSGVKLSTQNNWASTTINCTSSNVAGKRQTPVGGTLPWLVQSVTYEGCSSNQPIGPVTVTASAMPYMQVLKSGTAAEPKTQVRFVETKIAINYFGCEVRLSGILNGEGGAPASNPTVFTFAEAKSTLGYALIAQNCEPLFLSSSPVKFAATYTSSEPLVP